jgi:hypothetical protein
MMCKLHDRHDVNNDSQACRLLLLLPAFSQALQAQHQAGADVSGLGLA